MVAADAMKFMGVAGAASDLGVVGNADLAPVEKGWTYKVSKEFQITPAGESAAITVFVGDLLIAAADQGSGSAVDYNGGWYHVSSGFEDDNDPVLSASINDKKVILKNTVGAERGSVQFLTNKDSNVQITMSGSVDAATQEGNTTLTVEMVWGEFV